jgi:hypothetical protein
VGPALTRRLQSDAVAGPVILVIVLLLVLPPVVLVGGMIFSALLGWVATDDAEATHEGSELIDLNT